MKKIVNIVWYKTNNVGDTKTSPLDYYKFPLPVEKRDIKEDLSGLEDAFVIVGGGGIIHLPSPDYNNGHFGHLDALRTLGKYRVMWGVGHNVYFKSAEEGIAAVALMPDLSDFNLVGIRDLSYVNKELSNARYVPCVSCKSDIFKRPPIQGSGVGAVMHEGSIETKFPTITCEQFSFVQIIDFIRMFETIVTNSYHAMYWAELMGKKVMLTEDALSTKFVLHRPEPPQRRIARNDMFYNQVLELIYKYMEE